MEILTLAAGLLAGIPLGALADRRHLRAWIASVRAADIATTGQHRQQVLAEWQRRLRVVRHG
ncbi:hypothetical protein [Micromonospora sp. DT229]|uniref:hypothetical protein n=1 Tax=Micromonospora sp. DT229 TaxID=3393430 RepID=UPI003CF62CE6